LWYQPFSTVPRAASITRYCTFLLKAGCDSVHATMTRSPSTTIRGNPFRYAAAGGEFVAPTTLEAFAAERLAKPEARILAGSTDIGLWVNKMFRDLPVLLYIGAVDALKQIEVRDGVLAIGAGASLEDAWRALVARWPSLTDMWLRFAGVPLRHAGTMGGNARRHRSPIGDSACADGARRDPAPRRARPPPAARRLHTGYMQNCLEAGGACPGDRGGARRSCRGARYKIWVRPLRYPAVRAGPRRTDGGGAPAVARDFAGGWRRR
jgi:hypothetical protein